MLEKNIGFLTWDLPGHGLSPREPAGTYCHHSSLLLSINYIKEYMKWDKFSFLGHSMGGMLTGEYTMMNPGSMDFTICVDGLKPIQITDSLKNAGRLLKMFPRINSFVTSTREPPSYTSQQVMAMTTRIHGRSIAADHAHHLLERAIKPSKIKPGTISRGIAL
ncbi:unnamed protein product [Acanthoscelides obtectus]|nr:unnamed protein product [Acanthoscelides obtectus]CAK1654584.1 Serine hydrolase-like protein [Acanthoscelides obtectus]